MEQIVTVFPIKAENSRPVFKESWGGIIEPISDAGRSPLSAQSQHRCPKAPIPGGTPERADAEFRAWFFDPVVEKMHRVGRLFLCFFLLGEQKKERKGEGNLEWNRFYKKAFKTPSGEQKKQDSSFTDQQLFLHKHKID